MRTYYKLVREVVPGLYQSIAILPGNWVAQYEPGCWTRPSHAKSKLWCYVDASTASRVVTENRAPHGKPIELWSVETTISYPAKCCTHLGNVHRDVYEVSPPYDLKMTAAEAEQIALHRFWERSEWRRDYDGGIYHGFDNDTVIVADKVKLIAPLLRYTHVGDGLWETTVMVSRPCG